MTPRSPFDSTLKRLRRFSAVALTTTLATSIATSGAVLTSFTRASAAPDDSASATPAASTPAAPMSAAPVPAAPPPVVDKASCVAASDQGQSLRDGKHFIEARRALLLCAQDACPAVVRADCAQWLAQVDVSVPTLALIAHDGSGNDVLNVRVIIDGQVVATSLTGDSISVNPGPHHVRLEGPNGLVVERDILIREGEKNRGLSVTFGTEVPAVPSTTPGGTGSSGAPTQPPPAPAGVPPVAYVLGGVGVLALGSFTYFGLKGRSDVSNLRDTCGLYCTSSQVSSAHTKLYVADGSLLIGIGALAVATYLFVHASSEEAPPAPRSALLPSDLRFDASPITGGGVAFLSGRF